MNRYDWKSIFWGYWWLRGVIVSVPFLTAGFGFFPENTKKTLKALYLLVVSWGEVMEHVGRAVGLLPFIPELSALTVNTILLTVSLVIPAVWAYLVWVQPKKLLSELVRVDADAENLILELCKPKRALRYLQICFFTGILSVPIGFYGTLSGTGVGEGKMIYGALFFLYSGSMIFVISRIHSIYLKAIIQAFFVFGFLQLMYFFGGDYFSALLDYFICLLEGASNELCVELRPGGMGE